MVEKWHGLDIRLLEEQELDQTWTIDRSEDIRGFYSLVDGSLVYREEAFQQEGWPEGTPEDGHPVLLECLQAGGWVYGAFDGDQLAGAAVLESRFIGSEKDTLQLVFLHVGEPYRGRGLGRKLFFEAADRAVQAGADRLYISATPTGNTVQFYLNLGCSLAAEVDADLFEEEPEDIHMQYRLDGRTPGE